MDNDDDIILKQYIPVADFIGELLGTNAEVLIHDLRKTGNTIIFIKNNSITNRNVGDSITDFGLKLIQTKKFKEATYVANYPGTINDKRKKIRASTFFIKNTKDVLIGMLCVNVDISLYTEMQSHIEKLINMVPKEDDVNLDTHHEYFSNDLREMVTVDIENIVKDYNVEPARLSPQEKKQVVWNLASHNIFLVKGAVSMVAEALNMSEQSIYRYLQKRK